MSQPSSLKNYSKILLKGSAAITLADSSAKVLGLILVPLYTFYLTPTDYGTVSVVLLIITFLNLLYNPGMVSATQRLYHDTDVDERRMEVIGSAFVFFLFVPIIPIVLGLLIGERLTGVLFSNFDFYPYGLLAIVLAFFTQPKRIFIALFTLQYKIHKIAIFSFIAVILSITTTILLVVVFEMGAMGKVLGLFPSALFFFYLSFSKVLTYSNKIWSFSSIKGQLKLGAPLIIGIWSYEILHIADRYIIERMTDLSSLGLYSFSYQISEAPMMLLLGVRQLWNPIFYENMNSGNFNTISRLSFFYILGFSAIITMMILFIKEFTLLLINERYYSSIDLIPIILVGIFFNGLLVLTNSIFGFNKKFGSISVIALIAAVINVLLNILLIPKIGIIGSAIATLIAYLSYFLIALFLVRNEIKQIKITFGHAVPIIFILVSFLLTYALSSVFDSNISFLEIGIKILFAIVLLFITVKFDLIKHHEIKSAKSYYLEIIQKIKLKKI